MSIIEFGEKWKRQPPPTAKPRSGLQPRHFAVGVGPHELGGGGFEKVTGAVGYAFTTEGSALDPTTTDNRRITCAAANSSNFTIIARIVPQSVTGIQQLLAFDSSAGTIVRHFQLRSNGSAVDFIRFNTAPAAFTASIASSLQIGKPATVVAVSSGANVTLAINGALASATITGTPSTWVNHALVQATWFERISLAVPNEHGSHLSFLRVVLPYAIGAAQALEISRAPSPYAYLCEPRRIWVPVAAAGGGNTIAVPAGALTLAGYAPTVNATANQTVSVPAGALTLTGYAPTISVSADKTIAVPTGALTLTGFAPTVTATANQTVAVPAGALTLTGYAPDVLVDASQRIQVPLGQLTLTGFAPSVVTTANQVIAVPVGLLSLIGYAPTVSNGEEPVVVASQKGAGRPRRQQRRLVVEIDGSDFVVESEEEAVALLEKAKETAEENAKLAISRAAAAKRRKPSRVIADARKTLEVPSIIAPSIQAHADKILAEIRDTYESTMRSIEVAALLNKRDQDEEDDEDILLLMA